MGCLDNGKDVMHTSELSLESVVGEDSFVRDW